MTVVVVAGGGSLATLLVGLVTNAASEQTDWPGLLGVVQRHPWLSFLVLGCALVGFTVILAVLADGGESDRVPSPSPAAPGGSTAPDAAAVLRSLPRDTIAFTNRAVEMERLVGSVTLACENGEPLPVHAIDGMPGVGKTALAVRAGHALVDRFPDGQFFMNLNGHTPGRTPVQVPDALASLLAAAGVPTQRIPVSDDVGAVTEARAAMWRSQLAGKKVLLILDNAASAGQFEPLVPGGNDSLVIVTSRRRLAVQDEVVLPLSALPSEHAVALFIRLSGRAPQEFDLAVVEEVVGLCGYLPLGVSLLAARLRHHPAWTAEELRLRLVAASGRLSELRAGRQAVAATFDVSYEDLPPDRQRFFRCVGVFPGVHVDAFSAAALDSIQVAEARQQLDALYDDHLIEETAGGRYRLHDLIRDYARGLADEDGGMDRTQVVLRVCTYYLTVLAAANRHFARGSYATPTPLSGASDDVSEGRLAEGEYVEAPALETRGAALRWLDAERPNLLACIESARTQSLHSMVIRLAAAMAPFLRQEGPWDQATRLHRAAADAAQRVDDRQALGDAMTELGVVRRFMARYPEASRALTEAVSHYEAVGDLRGKAYALNQAGIVWYLTADNEASARAQRQALEIYRGLADRFGQANALADLGMVLRQSSRFEPAVEAQSEALSIYREFNDRYGEANSLRDLGVVRCLMGDYAEAAQRQSAALSIYRDLDDRDHQAYALNELGTVSRLTGDLPAAREAHAQALEYYTDLGDQFGRANSIRHLAAVERLTGSPEDALRSQEQALALYRDLGSRGGEAAALSELGLARLDTGDFAGAAEALEQSLQMHRELGDRYREAEVLNHCGTLLLASREPDAARVRFREALRPAQEIACPLEVARALEGIGRCSLATGESAQAEASLRDALAHYRRLGTSAPAAEIERLLRE